MKCSELGMNDIVLTASDVILTLAVAMGNHV